MAAAGGEGCAPSRDARLAMLMHVFEPLPPLSAHAGVLFRAFEARAFAHYGAGQAYEAVVTSMADSLDRLIARKRAARDADAVRKAAEILKMMYTGTTGRMRVAMFRGALATMADEYVSMAAVRLAVVAIERRVFDQSESGASYLASAAAELSDMRARAATDSRAFGALCEPRRRRATRARCGGSQGAAECRVERVTFRPLL